MKIDLDKVRGENKFRDFWFRNPKLKEDSILKRIIIKNDLDEQATLEGESGCGMSFFANLPMKFYDLDFRGVFFVIMRPIILNYTILDNFLHHRSDTSNNEVFTAINSSISNERIKVNDKIRKKDKVENK
jgi:hypothetical protein